MTNATPLNVCFVLMMALFLSGGCAMEPVNVTPPVLAPEQPAPPEKPPASPKAKARPAKPSAGRGDYILQPNDNLDIKFFYNPELNENVTIRPDGKIALQLIDEISAAGYTPAQLDKLLTKKYAKQLKQPMLTVILRTFEGQKVYVGGEVTTPQVLTMAGNMNALQAVFEAGGFTADAKLSTVLIVSRGSGQPRVRKVDLKDALHGDLLEERYALQPFDIVYVPKTIIARTDEFLTHLYNFIPRNIGLGFSYELHDATDYDRAATVTP